MQAILVAIVGTLAAVVFGAALVWAFLVIQRAGRSLAECAAKMESTSAELARLSAALLESSMRSEAMLQGLVAVSKEQVAALTSLQESTVRLSRMFTNGGDNDGYIQYAERDAGDEFEIDEIMKRTGANRSEAAERMRQARLYDKMRVTPG